MVLLANGWDIDGDYQWTEFYVNGANALIQFKENLDPDEIKTKINNEYISYIKEVTLDSTLESLLEKLLEEGLTNARIFRGNTICN